MSSSGIHTVDRAVRSLIAIAEHAPISVAEVARQVQVPVSTTYRYLAELRSHGLVWELPGKLYAAGPRCVQLESSFQRTFRQSSYRQIMEELADRSGETVAYLVPQDRVAICIDTVESTHPLRYTFSKGIAKPMLRGASAKAMLPWLDQEALKRRIADSADLDEEERNSLMEELPLIRKQGHAVSLSEVDQGVWAVGAPVFKANGELDGSISVIAPYFRVQGGEQRYIKLVVEASRAMTTSNGWEYGHGD